MLKLVSAAIVLIPVIVAFAIGGFESTPTARSMSSVPCEETLAARTGWTTRPSICIDYTGVAHANAAKAEQLCQSFRAGGLVENQRVTQLNVDPHPGSLPRAVCTREAQYAAAPPVDR